MLSYKQKSGLTKCEQCMSVHSKTVFRIIILESSESNNEEIAQYSLASEMQYIKMFYRYLHMVSYKCSQHVVCVQYHFVLRVFHQLCLLKLTGSFIYSFTTVLWVKHTDLLFYYEICINKPMVVSFVCKLISFSK